MLCLNWRAKWKLRPHCRDLRAAVLANLVAHVYSDKNLDSRRDASANATQWLEDKLAEQLSGVDDDGLAFPPVVVARRVK